MDNAAGTAVVLVRAHRGCQGHLLGRQLLNADSEFDACILLYNAFADWTQLLFFVKIAC